jgi:ribosome-associated protein
VGISSTIPVGASSTLALAKTTGTKPATKKKTVKKVAAKAAEPIVEQVAVEPSWPEAVAAAEEKQARDIRVLDLREVTSFADYFVVCNGTNTRQNQAISDSIEVSLKHLGRYPLSIEGYSNADWILLDYGDFLVHVFTEKARAYYDLERLWRDAKIVTPATTEPRP